MHCAVVRNVQRSYRAPPLPPIPRSDDNKDAVIQPGTLRFPLAQTAEGAPISSVFWGRSTLSETDRLQNEFERPLAPPDPRSPESEEADLPTVVRKVDLSSSRTPTAFRGSPGTQARARPTP